MTAKVTDPQKEVPDHAVDSSNDWREGSETAGGVGDCGKANVRKWGSDPVSHAVSHDPVSQLPVTRAAVRAAAKCCAPRQRALDAADRDAVLDPRPSDRPGPHLLGPTLGLELGAVQAPVQARAAANRAEHVGLPGREQYRRPDLVLALAGLLHSTPSFAIVIIVKARLAGLTPPGYRLTMTGQPQIGQVSDIDWADGSLASSVCRRAISAACSAEPPQRFA